MWTTLRCISIGSYPTIDIFSMDYPPILIIIRPPSEPFSLDSSHALTPIVLGCSSAYGMHVCNFQYSLITCKYINMNILAQFKSHNHVMKFYNSYIKISSLGLMIKHEQFNLNHSTQTQIHTKYIFVTLFLRTVKP